MKRKIYEKQQTRATELNICAIIYISLDNKGVRLRLYLRETKATPPPDGFIENPI